MVLLSRPSNSDQYSHKIVTFSMTKSEAPICKYRGVTYQTTEEFVTASGEMSCKYRGATYQTSTEAKTPTQSNHQLTYRGLPYWSIP